MSKPIYAICDFEEFKGIVWQTSKGYIVTLEGKINPQSDLSIRDCDNGEEIKDIDMRDILMDILPFKN
jgi:hypothetical protein